jgi:hypothetical protein
MGATGTQGGRYIDSTSLFEPTFGNENSDWPDAHKDWRASVSRVVDKIAPVLKAGGRVWVHEAGQSDFTADWITSDYAREEAIRNIRAKRSDWEEGFALIMKSISVIPGIDNPLGVEINPKDRPILATAISQKCDRLITGDKRDFGHLFQKTIQGVTILTPLQFAEEISST